MFRWNSALVLGFALAALLVAVPVSAKDGNLYLVHFEATAAAAPTSPGQAVELLEGLILPSLEQLAKEGRIEAGGLYVGARAGVFILRAESHEAATKMIRSIPAWGVWDWKVKPLESFQHRIDVEKKVVEAIKGS